MKFFILCARHPVSVLMVYAAIILFGVAALPLLNVELLPTIRIPVARVITEYPDIPPEEVEQLVTIPLENALSSVKGVKRITSLSRDSISAVTLTFGWEQNIEVASVEIREKIDAVYPSLPHGIKKPVVATEDLSDEPVISLAVFPRKTDRSLGDISDMVREDFKTRLLQIRGVSDLRIAGIEEFEIKVNVIPDKLHAANLSLSDVAETINASVFENPAGTIREKDLEYLVKAGTDVRTIMDLKNLPLLSSRKKTTLTIDDIADVSLGIKEKTSFFHSNGEPAIGIFIKKTGSMGTFNAARAIIAELANIRELYKNDLRVDVIDDASMKITDSIINLAVSILIGIAATFIVLVPLFRKTVYSLITMSAVPVCIATVLFSMFMTGLSINLVSLSGIAIGIGMIVDNAIVVLENLIEHRARTPEEIGTRTIEMGSATFGSTITTLLVFVPVLFLPGITGALFRDLSLTIIYSMTASFIMSLTLIPALYTLFVRNPMLAENRFIARIERGYGTILRAGMKRPVIVFSILFALIVAGVFAFTMLKKEIMPRTDSGIIEAEFTFQKGMDIHAASRSARDIEQAILRLPFVHSIYSEAGFDINSLKDRARKERAVNRLQSRILLKPDRREKIEEVKEIISFMVGGRTSADFLLSVPEDSVSKLIGQGDNVTLLLTGEDREKLRNRSEAIITQMTGKDLVIRAETDTVKNSPEIRFEVNRDSLAFGNINVASVLETLSAAVRGVVPAKLTTDEKEIEIRVQYVRGTVDSLEALERIRVPMENGTISIKSLGTLKREFAFGDLSRADRKNAVSIRFIPRAGKTDRLTEALTPLLTRDTVLASASALQSGYKEIGLVFLFALILMYLVLGAQFESLVIPLLLFIALPVSIGGSLLTLLVFQKSLNVNSFLGILILLGTTINSAIILCASYKQKRMDHILSESIGRIRPVYGTVATTVLALIPVAFQPFRTQDVQSHMALAVMGGLVVGTIATLIIFPVFYAKIYKIRQPEQLQSHEGDTP